jgi:hypothetical protein
VEISAITNNTRQMHCAFLKPCPVKGIHFLWILFMYGIAQALNFLKLYKSNLTISSLQISAVQIPVKILFTRTNE